MKTYDPGLPLISIHIPKCAGSSFSDVLRRWFGRNFLRHYPKERSNRPPRRHSLQTGFFRKRPRHGLCIHGHFNNDRGYGVRDYYPDATQFITVIRDPFDLHLSTYFFVKKEAQTGRSGAYRSGQLHPIIENRWNLEEFLENYRNSYIRSFLPPEITLDNHEAILENQFLYMGISERLQRSVDILAGILGFPTVPVPQRNVSEWTEKIPDGAREAFEAHNALEMAIYRYALNHWGNSA